MKSLVRDVMTTEVVTVDPWTPFTEIVTRLAEHRISAAPVLDAEGNVLGVVTEADLLLKQEHPDLELNVPLAWSRRRRLERDKAAAVVAGKLMTSPPVTVPPTATITEAARACIPPASSGCRWSTRRAGWSGSSAAPTC